MPLDESLKLLLKHKTVLLSTHNIYSNKKETSDFHGTVYFDPVKMLQQKINQNVYQTSSTQKMVLI